MRLCKISVIGLCVLAATSMVMSQPPGQKGGKGKGPDTGYIGLFQNPQVRAELKVSDEQLARLPAASLKALADVLSPDQLKRLRGIYLQQKSNAAYLEADIRAELKITADQAKAIQAALDEQNKAQAALFESGGFDPQKMQELQKTATGKIESVLTQEQKTAWTGLVGQPIQIAGGGGFGGGGFGGGKGKVDPAAFDKMVKQALAALPDKAPAKPKQPRKLLIYSKTGGFRHSSIELGVKTLTALGEKTGAYSAFATEDEAIFEPEKLKQFDGVFMVSTTGDFLRPANVNVAEREAREELLRKSLVDFVQGGKGLMGLHAATDSYPKSWPLYASIIGGGFQSHPWTKLVPVKNVDASNPVNASLEGKDFEVDDEIYQFRLDTARPTQLRYLLVLDVVKMGPDALRGNRKGDGPYPVSWIGNIGKGRVYYNSLGHREQIFWNPTVLKHYLAGIQFALGDMDADATPTATAAK